MDHFYIYIYMAIKSSTTNMVESRNPKKKKKNCTQTKTIFNYFKKC